MSSLLSGHSQSDFHGLQCTEADWRRIYHHSVSIPAYFASQFHLAEFGMKIYSSLYDMLN
eukprot:COSAG01_NODE_34221_length_551_cov_0.964602_1_plen_59_part_10